MPAACLFLASGPADVDLACPVELAVARWAAWVQIQPLLAVLLLVVGLAALVAWIAVARAGRREARRRARALLREYVTAAQVQQLRDGGYLEVPSRLYAHRCYRIPDWQGRVQVYEGEHRVGELCLVARSRVPDADMVLTHKWLIEADEVGYLATANWLPISPAYGRDWLEAPNTRFR